MGKRPLWQSVAGVKREVAASLALGLVLLSLGGCGGGNNNASSSKGCTGSVSGKFTLTAWYHSGRPEEVKERQDEVDAFNKSQDKVTVVLKTLANGVDYNSQVQAAAASHQLPDILDFDGPNIYNYAWNKAIQPIDSCISPSFKANLLQAAIDQATYAGRTWSVAEHQGSCGLYARKSILQKNGIRIPTGPADAWTKEEFTSILGTLKQAGYAHPLDLKMNYGKGEWLTFGFSPVIQSAGGDLIDRTHFQSANGVLNGATSVQSLTIVQSWFKSGYVDPNTDDNAFVNRRTPISWVGAWEYSRYKKSAGDDLLVLPLPNFGQGSKAGNGSWSWAISSTAKNVDAAWQFINFSLQDPQQLNFAAAAGASPATKSALAKDPLWAKGGDMYLYSELLNGPYTVTRPQTPAYPTITVAFANAFWNISTGSDVKHELDQAVATIDQNIKDNQGYPPPSS
jgi:multiple sugar transport system substrate-binding protein